MAFWYFVAMVVLTVLYVALTPKPDMNNQDARPAEESAFKFPTAEEGKDLPVVFGTRRCASPNVVWWGDLDSEAIIEEVDAAPTPFGF